LPGKRPHQKPFFLALQNRTELVSTTSTRAECFLCFGFANFVRRLVPEHISHWLPVMSAPRGKTKLSRGKSMLSGT
jgi:hypothetical protein